jgi:dephospho-CoA kinase
VDVAVCVTAPLPTRIARVMHRDGISREQTLEWMSRQWPQEEVARRADFIIVNDGCQDVDEQITRVLMALEKWKR